MCGLVGYVGSNCAHRMPSALAAIRHRGPDAEGTFTDTQGGRHIGLGHVRLSIIDLSAGAHQPFFSVDQQHVLVYNGEIYNHKALRAELEALGWSFRTHSDTEVLLAGLIHWGHGVLPRLDGIFAFAWLDRSQHKLTLVRDRLGIKPLYVHQVRSGPQRGDIRFASEIKALAALSSEPLQPDKSCFAEFLLNGFLYEPASGIEGIGKLFPGTALAIDLHAGRQSTHVYAEPLVPRPSGISPGNSSNHGFAELAVESTRAQLMADVRVGLSFSGGIDSSVLAMAAPQGVAGLFVSFKGTDQSESDSDDQYAQQIARALALELEVGRIDSSVSNENFLDSVTHVARGTEEPISNYTYVASERIAQMARARGYTVLLSGMGGDELFAGYPRHRLLRHTNLLRQLSGVLAIGRPLLRRSRALSKKTDRLLAFSGENNFGLAYSNLVGYFGAADVIRLLGNNTGIERYISQTQERLAPVANQSWLRQAMYLDTLGFLAQNLTVTDKSAMAHGVEVRVPLLSNDMLGYSAHLRDDQFDVAKQGKKPMRDYLLTRLPHELVHRKKLPFNPPLDGAIRRLGADVVRDELTRGPITTAIDGQEAKAQIQAHFEGTVNNTYRLWQLLYFSRWLKTLSSASSH